MMLPPSSRKGALGLQKGPRMEEEVGKTPDSEAILWAISSTRLGYIRYDTCVEILKGYLRFESNDVGDAMPFISLLIANLSHGIHELDTYHPLIDGEFDFSSKVMDMSDQS
jgi:hypothetical protein